MDLGFVFCQPTFQSFQQQKNRPWPRSKGHVKVIFISILKMLKMTALGRDQIGRMAPDGNQDGAAMDAADASGM